MRKILISILIITIVTIKANAETLYGGKPISILSSRVSDLESVVKGYFLSNITGINYDNTTGNFDLDIGYIIPTSDLLSSFLTNESDPIFSNWNKSDGISIYENQITDLQTYLTSESDPVFANSKDSYDSHLTNTSNPHSVTKAQVGLSNVTDNEQIPVSYLDTDILLTANSDVKIPSQKAIKTYTDALVDALVVENTRLIMQQYVLSELSRIVTTPANIKRVIFYDETGETTTIKDRSTNKLNATLSKDADELSPTISGDCKFLNFNGADEYYDFADAADLSFGNGTTDSPFSIVVLLQPNVTANSIIWAKIDTTTGSTQREWRLTFSGSGNMIKMQIYDDSTGGRIGRATGSLIDDTTAIHTYIPTYSGNSNNSGIKIYRDAVRADTKNDSSGTYTAMENKTAKAGNYCTLNDGSKAYVGKFSGGFKALIAEELSQTQVTAIDSLLKAYAGVREPYLN